MQYLPSSTFNSSLSKIYNVIRLPQQVFKNSFVNAGNFLLFIKYKFCKSTWPVEKLSISQCCISKDLTLGNKEKLLAAILPELFLRNIALKLSSGMVSLSLKNIKSLSSSSFDKSVQYKPYDSLVHLFWTETKCTAVISITRNDL